MSIYIYIFTCVSIWPSIILISFISIGNSGTQDDPVADATAEAHEAEVAEVVDPASEVSDQSWIMEEPSIYNMY